MNYAFQLSIPEHAFSRVEQFMRNKIENARQSAQNAMADIFYETVKANFGLIGLDRPSDWPELSAAYAKRVNREAATLYVTGALEGALKINYGTNESSVSISNSDVPYALIHQFGGWAGRNHASHIPARPYFPIDTNGRVTDYTQESVKDIARIQFAKEMR